jgi:HAD superfamily hydrolase (TIGR01509 family)
VPDAVIFDLDGVLLDSEQLWNRAKAEIVDQTGGRWREEAPRAMMGMSSTEWARYMSEELEVPLDAEEINRRVVARMEELYRTELPLLPGALQVVEATHRRWPLGLASSSNREIIDLFLTETALTDVFAATVSSEEVQRGKPAPDVYLETARRMGVRAERSVAVEDSSNGLKAAAAAGMAVIAVPNPHYPPDADALELASATASAVAEITPELVEAASRSAERQ